MVQRGAQAMHEVSADDRQLDRRLLLKRYADAVGAGLVVHFDRVSVGFTIDPAADFVCKGGHQVLDRPVELGVDAV
jgi:hypothetical protein